MMSENDIRERFQSKLSGFEAPLPADGWESVERSLKAAAAARTALRRRWYAGSAAAILLLLVGGILFIQNPVEQPEMMVSESTSTTLSTDSTADTVTEAVSVPERLVSPATTERQQLVATSAKAKGVKAPAGRKTKGQKTPLVRPANPEEMMTAWMVREKLQGGDVERGMDADALSLLAKSVEKDAGQNGARLPAEEVIIVAEDHDPLRGAVERGEESLLLAFNGRGGLTGYQQTVNLPMTLRSAAVGSDNKYMSDANRLQLQANDTGENVSKKEHDQPVSFGIMVSKQLFDDLFIETGLVYSYLRSRTRNTSNNFKEMEVQKLHYLGVPLNVNYNLFSLGQLNVYASMGGMVEKDISGEFLKINDGQTVNLDNASGKLREVEKISFRNPQFSVNAGLGLSYPLYDRLRLYGKVGGAYYFDAKNQDRKTNRVYRTIYSDRQIVMDLNVGVRYEF